LPFGPGNVFQFDRNLLCDGQSIKQGRLCVKGNGGARCGCVRQASKKCCDETTCGLAPGLIIMRYVGEKILFKAKKCKHCGEFLNTALGTQNNKDMPTPQGEGFFLPNTQFRLCSGLLDNYSFSPVGPVAEVLELAPSEMRPDWWVDWCEKNFPKSAKIKNRNFKNL